MRNQYLYTDKTLYKNGNIFMVTKIGSKLKATLSFLVVCTLLATGFSAFATADDTSPMRLDIEIGQNSYSMIESEQGITIEMQDYGRIPTIGGPTLPSKIVFIAIPQGAIVKDVTYTTGSDIVLDGQYDIAPVPAAIPLLEDGYSSDLYTAQMQQYEANYQSIYGSDEAYPQKIVEFVQTSGYRQYNLVEVRVTPFTYHPLSKALIYHEDIEVFVDYEFPDEQTQLNSQNQIAYPSLEAQDIIINFQDTYSWYTQQPLADRDTYDYVVITLDSLTDDITALTAWETMKGRSVYVATTNWISSTYSGYDLAAKMRAFLRDKYLDWGIEYVCLIGDYDDVPMRRTSQDVGYGQPETDFYYAELSYADSSSWDSDGDHNYGENSDSIDYVAEVHVGRIPWSNPSTVSNICEKSAAYEQNDDDSYKENILLLGAFFWDNDPNPVTDNAVLMEEIVSNSWFSTWDMTRMYEVGYSSYSCDADITNANVVSDWSSNRYGFVNWAGHGSPTGCYRYHPSTAFITSSNCPSLNDNYPAIIFADACSNSDTDNLNLGQSMIKQGGVGFLGATKVAMGSPGWDSPNDGSSQSMDYYFTTSVTSHARTQGQAHTYTLKTMYQYGLWNYNKYETFEWGALWGNPDLGMEYVSGIPAPSKPITPSGTEYGEIGQTYTYRSRCTHPDDLDVQYRWSFGDGTTTEWSDFVAPDTLVSMAHSWDHEGYYGVRVQARDTDGYEGLWSDSLLVTISYPNDAPLKPAVPTGPTQVETGEQATFSFQTQDPDGDEIQYRMSWGDGTYSDWTEWVASGTEEQLSYSWNTAGTYSIRIQAQDHYEDKSGWSDQLRVTVFDETNSPPEVEIVEPSDGALISGVVRIAGVASDPDGDSTIRSVEVSVDGSFYSVYGSESWYLNFDFSEFEPGMVEIAARAWDGEFYSELDVISVEVEEVVNAAPDTPQISGPSEGKFGTEYAFNFTANDPDGDDIMFVVDWGDGSTEETSLVSSGQTIQLSHTWTESTVDGETVDTAYLLKAKAVDSKDAESDWGTMDVTMPYTPENPFVEFIQAILQIVLERFPILGQLFSFF